MQKRTLKVALLAVLATVLVLSFSAIVLADQTWSDLPDTVTAKYGITDNQVAGISEGFLGGLWKPYQAVTRAQFVKMAVAAFNVPLKSPATASFADVPVGSYYFPYIEGAKAAGIVNGSGANFRPNDNITRQEAIAIVARFVADANGYDLKTMYTSDEIDTLLQHFGDAASISADLKAEVAFAFDMGLTNGDDYGNVNPLANMTRIQGAAFLIRAQGLVPPAHFTPAKIELVSTDKTEGLIGQTFSATFEVTTADGHPAIGVLVDFDSLGGAEFYVGNVTQQAAMTNNYGQVTVDLLSLEPGTQRVTASVAGVGTIYTTRYWLVLDECYTTTLPPVTAQNNVGVEHTWGARVVVFGPGPRSTAEGDWYNAINTAPFDPTNINWFDGVDVTCDSNFAIDDNWNFGTEKILAALGYTPRTLAGIDVDWSIYDIPDNPATKLTNEAVTSVGKIIKVDGTAITPAKTAVGKTDASGYSSIVIYSEQTGVTLTQAIATYKENPYPQQLFNHNSFQDWQSHDVDWYGQPATFAVQQKTWISHTIGGAASNIAPADSTGNLGEEKILTLTLVDQYGNAKSGVQVEWTMQGVGFFQTDDSQDTSDTYVAANNKDIDITDANGKCTLFVKSYMSGEQVVHAKYRDKGVGGAEGKWYDDLAEVQWFDVDIATFDDITTPGQWVWSADADAFVWLENNEALSTNPVNTTHTFNCWVYGLKLEYLPSVDEPDGQTPFIDSDFAGASYDGIIDARDAAYFNGILMCPAGVPDSNGHYLGGWFWDDKYKKYYEWKNPDDLPYDEDGDGIIERYNSNGIDERGTAQIKVGGVWLTLSFEGAYTMYDYDDDGYKEAFTGSPGIYLPLAGKTVKFSKANEAGAGLSNLGAFFDGTVVPGVGSFTPASAVTDAAGKVSVSVSSTTKGPETIKATVDWAGNPHNGSELLTCYAKKDWTAGIAAAASDVTIEVYIDGVKVATNKAGELASGDSAAWTEDPDTGDLYLNSAHVEVHVLDAYGNDLPDYEVVYLLEDLDGWLGGSQNAADTWIPWAYLVDKDIYNNKLDPFGTVYDQNGSRPDADEPSPDSDPYAFIVGPGGTPSFFFNQWLGSDKPTYHGQPGVEIWWTRVQDPYFGFDQYFADYLAAAYAYTWPEPGVWADYLFNGFDGVLEYGEPSAPDTIGLATDGAKAWTLDGYYDAGNGDIEPNLLTGSNIDIQLADDIAGAWEVGIHIKNILRIMVYAPANGLVQEGSYIWSTQVHQVWEPPVPTTITLAPASDYAIAGMESQSLVATVKDQFGRPMPNWTVSFISSVQEGTISAAFDGSDTADTDANGNASVNWGQGLGDWGVEKVYAFIDYDNDDMLDPWEPCSNASVIQWVYEDEEGNLGDLVAAYDTEQKVTAYAGFSDWDGFVLKAYLNPGGAVLGSGTYDDAVDLEMSTILHTWVTGEGFFVHAVSTDTDGVPNWVHDEVQ